MVGVGEHGHDLFADLLRLIREVDAVAQGLAHLCLAINAGQPQARLIAGENDLRFCERLSVNGVELVDDLQALFQHRHLVFTSWNRGCVKCSDICCLTDGIAEKAYRNACLEVAHLNLRFYRGIALYTGNCHQIHIVKRQLCQFRYHGLDENRRFCRIQSACQIVQCHLNDVLPYFFRMLSVVCQRLCISNHNIDLVVLSGILQPNPFFQGTHIVPDVQPAGRTVPC